jgi:hypothetical protein
MDLVDGCSSKLSELITISFSKRDIFLQRNACAALTAIMTCDPSLYLAAAKAPTLALGLVRCLKGEPESQVDSGLQLNAAAALSVLAQQYTTLPLHCINILKALSPPPYHHRMKP